MSFRQRFMSLYLPSENLVIDLRMPRRINMSQLRSAQTRQRQAVQRYNTEVRRYNSRRIDAYNRAVRSYNRLRSNHYRLQSALQRLAEPAPHSFRRMNPSLSLSTAYERLDNGDADPFLSDLAERETANSVSVLNALLGEPYLNDENTLDSVDEQLLSPP